MEKLKPFVLLIYGSFPLHSHFGNRMRSFVLISHPNVRNSHANNRSAIFTCSQCLICCERSHAKGVIFNMADVKVEWSTELVETLIENVRLNQVVWEHRQEIVPPIRQDMFLV